MRLSQQLETRGWESFAPIAFASIAGKADSTQVHVAAEHIRKGISIAEERKARAMAPQGYLFLGELFADAGQRDEAIGNLKRAEAMYLEMKVKPKSHWLARARQTLERLTS